MTAPPALPSLGPEDVEELRLALVMNGGVSLAVWIGGVTCEINRLVRGQGVYADLLRATGTEARVDVISGTSAGGINGALLGLASVYDVDLSPLREVWLNQGALEELLRSPVEPDPPSLLKGDEYFLAELQRAFAALRKQGTADPLPAARVPMELTLTTTLLHGNPNTIPDDFGTVIADVNHRARFVFRRGPDVDFDSFNDGRIAERLAFASRATASFPVAFEPRFYPADNPDSVGAPIARDTRNLHVSRFLLDGGILDNKPLESAIDAIFTQRADRDVRRILAYVVPNPGATAEPAADVQKETPGLGQVALASLMELPRVESISAQIESVVRQNQQVRRKHQNRAGVMCLGLSTLRQLAVGLFPVYRRRRLESAADYLFPEISLGLAARTKGKSALGRRLRDWLTGQFLDAGHNVPWTPQFDPTSADAESERKNWRWGVFALENMADTTLDVLRRSLRLTSPGPQRRQIRNDLMTLRKEAFDLFAEVRRRRANDSGFWRDQSAAIQALLEREQAATSVADQVRMWLQRALGEWNERFNARETVTLSRLGYEMARIILIAAEIFREHFAREESWARAEDRAAQASLRQHFDVLAPPGATTDAVLTNLLSVEVVLNAFGSYRDVRDQYVELVQMSADVPTSFGGPDAAERKLAGAQLANFGAFLKRSWRANDWMFGRLDGVERLSRIVLSPDRLRRLYSGYAAGPRADGANNALDVIHWVAVRGVESRADRLFLEKQWRIDLQRIQRELAFLEDSGIPIPEQLPICAAAITRRLQLEIIRHELPELARAVEYDIHRGGDPRGYGSVFKLAMDQAMRASQGRPIAPETIVSIFAQCRVGDERIGKEVGSDLFTSLASRAAAVSVAAGASEHSKLGPVRKLFQMGRVPAIAFDFLAQGLVGQSRTMVSLFTAALTVSGALLMLGLAYADEMPGILLSTGGVLLVATMSVAFLRHHWLALGATLLGGVLMIVGLGPDWLSDLGLRGDGRTWWRIAAVSLFLALVCTLAYIVAHGPRQRFRWKRTNE